MVFLFGFGKQERPYRPIHMALLFIFVFLPPSSGPSTELGAMEEEQEASILTQEARSLSHGVSS